MVAAAVHHHLASLTLDDERDLRWYFNESDGAYGGLRSNFGAQLERAAALASGRRRKLDEQLEDEPQLARRMPDVDDVYDEEARMIARIDSMRDRRVVERRLELVDAVHARSLERTFTVEIWSGDRSYVELRFGRLAALAVAIHVPPAVPRPAPSPEHSWLNAEFGRGRLVNGHRSWSRGRLVAAAVDIDRGGEPDVAWLCAICKRAARGIASAHDTRALDAIERNADALLGQASSAYLWAKDRVPSPQRWHVR